MQVADAATSTANKAFARDKLQQKFLSPAGAPIARLAGAAARAFLDQPETLIFDTKQDGSQTGEPDHCGHAAVASKWYAIDPQEDGILLVSTEGTQFDTVLEVYLGPKLPRSFADLTSIACDDNSGADQRTSRLTIPVQRGKIYQVCVDGVGGASGKVTFNYNLGKAPQVTEAPASKSVSAGESVSLRVVAQNSSPWQYQWRHNGIDIAGATASTLEIPSASADWTGAFSCLVWNFAGSTLSPEGILSLNPPFELSAASVAPGAILFQVDGAVGARVIIEATTNFVDWEAVFTNQNPTGPFQVAVPLLNASQFYRALK